MFQKLIISSLSLCRTALKSMFVYCKKITCLLFISWTIFDLAQQQHIFHYRAYARVYCHTQQWRKWCNLGSSTNLEQLVWIAGKNPPFLHRSYKLVLCIRPTCKHYLSAYHCYSSTAANHQTETQSRSQRLVSGWKIYLYYCNIERTWEHLLNKMINEVTF